jgi:nucleoside 2-deoxyribosyltransferase
MATGTAGTSARHLPTQQTHYLIKKVVFGDSGTALEMGYVPAGSIVVRAYVVVKTLFNGGGTDTLQIGYADDADEFYEAASTEIASVGLKEDVTTMNDAANLVFTADTQITVTYTDTNADATTGLAYAVVEYVVDPAVVDA